MVHSARPLDDLPQLLGRAAGEGEHAGRPRPQVSARKISSSPAEAIAVCARSSSSVPHAADPAVREQHEAVADPFGVDQLMDGQHAACAHLRATSRTTAMISRVCRRSKPSKGSSISSKGCGVISASASMSRRL